MKKRLLILMLLLITGGCKTTHPTRQPIHYETSEDATELLEQGKQSIDRGDWEAGKRKLLSLVYQFPQSKEAPTGYAILGYEHYKRNKCASAVLYLEKAAGQISLEPRMTQALSTCREKLDPQVVPPTQPDAPPTPAFADALLREIEKGNNGTTIQP